MNQKGSEWDANAGAEITGLSGADRRLIKIAQMHASDQIALLEQGRTSNGSDSHPYRHLATKGVAPGYNFLVCRSMPSSLEKEKPALSSSALDS